jgi:hypothetical protein
MLSLKPEVLKALIKVPYLIQEGWKRWYWVLGKEKNVSLDVGVGAISECAT